MMIDMRQLMDGADILAGSTKGANALAKLISHVAKVTEIEVVLLDFRSVDVATSSFVRAAVLGFRDYCRASRPNLYPVVCNANETVREELEGLLQLRGDALVLSEANRKGSVTAATIIGKLEEKQRVTLQAVLEAKRVDAVTLSRAQSKDKLSPTAWNNRLTSLLAKGILKECQVGRVKVYEPVVEALCYGA